MVQGSEGAGTLLKYNPHINLTVAQQRQRLPIFQVSGNCIVHKASLCVCARAAVQEPDPLPGGELSHRGHRRRDRQREDHTGEGAGSHQLSL